MNRIRKHADTLLNFNSWKKKEMREFKQTNISKDFVKAVSEICFNILHNCLALNNEQISCLRKYKKKIRNLTDRSLSLTEKRKIVQRGGFLSFLLSTLGGVLLQQLIEKATK